MDDQRAASFSPTAVRSLVHCSAIAAPLTSAMGGVPACDASTTFRQMPSSCAGYGAELN